MSKVGLVLSGGGAKGAYQVGVIKAMIDMDMSADMVSGASIGALNGAVLASAPSFEAGAERLDELWHLLPSINPVQFKPELEFGFIGKKFNLHPSVYIALLLASGLRLGTPIGWISAILSSNSNISSLLSEDPLKDMMEKFLDLDALQTGLPLFVSVYKQKGKSGILDFLEAVTDVLKNTVLGTDNQPSEFWQIQSKPLEQQKQMILASAALPFLFKAFESENGERFTDGGQGGWTKSQGNTPIQPLIDAGCDHIIVTHLTDGSLWHRHDFPETSILEVRPSEKFGGITKLLDFSESHILGLINQGYHDATQAFAKSKEAITSLQMKRKNQQKLVDSFSSVEASKKRLEDKMARLKR